MSPSSLKRLLGLVLLTLIGSSVAQKKELKCYLCAGKDECNSDKLNSKECIPAPPGVMNHCARDVDSDGATTRRACSPQKGHVLDTCEENPEKTAKTCFCREDLCNGAISSKRYLAWTGVVVIMLVVAVVAWLCSS